MLTKNARKKLESYFGTSYRRRKIDATLEAHRHLFSGVVLDIGGRDRGNFIKPKSTVTRWIFADIVSDFNPDIILDVTAMPQIENESIDVISAMELFEHVNHPEKGVLECYRVLRSNGYFIASTPFMYGIHADPHDFQRWTDSKWQLVLRETGFKDIKIISLGTGISTSLDLFKALCRYNYPLVKYISFFFYPILNLLERLDSTRWAKESILGKYVGGYFIIARK